MEWWVKRERWKMMERKGTDYKINIRTPMGAALFSFLGFWTQTSLVRCLCFPPNSFVFFFLITII
jgi:hypothetical protein